MPPKAIKQVRAPRSKGCRMCVQRRVKCDLTKPYCMRCVKGNRPCPGYESSIRFYDEGPKLREHYHVTLPLRPKHNRRSQSLLDDNDNSSQSFYSPSAHHLRHGSVDSETLSDNLQHIPSSHLERSALLTLISPSAFQAQLLAQFVNSFRSCNLKIDAGNHTWNTWLQELARYPNSTPMLDYAIRAISLSHLGRSFDDQNIILSSRKQYGKALLRLNATLRSAASATSTETLVATVILSFYEILNCTSQGSWVRHACGVARLLQLRGPEPHRHGLARSTLAAYRSFLIVEALAARQPCFLDSSIWRNLFQQISADASRDPFRDALEVFYTELAEHPGYLHAVNTTAPSADPQALQKLVWRGQLLRSNIKHAHLGIVKALRNDGLEPTEAMSDEDDNVFPIIYKYPSTYIGSLYCGYWTVLTILDQTLRRLEMMISMATQRLLDRLLSPNVDLSDWKYSRPLEGFSKVRASGEGDSSIRQSDLQAYDREIIECARKSCMSVENLSSTVFLGSTYLVFALRAASVVLESSLERDWIHGRLRQISQNVGIAKYNEIHLVVRTSGKTACF